MKCLCRHCDNEYDNQKSRADYTGYCSQKCLKEAAKALGWRPKDGHYYHILSSNHAIGDVPVKGAEPKAVVVGAEEEDAEMAEQREIAEKRQAFLDAVQVHLDTYISEAEHQDGDGYWLQFPTPNDTVRDFADYLKAVTED